MYSGRGVIPIVERGVIPIVEHGIIPIVEQGVIPIVEQGVLPIVEWGVIPIVEWGVINRTSYAPSYLLFFPTFKYTKKKTIHHKHMHSTGPVQCH